MPKLIVKESLGFLSDNKNLDDLIDCDDEERLPIFKYIHNLGDSVAADLSTSDTSEGEEE